MSYKAKTMADVGYRDYFKTLGVGRNASESDIKRAFRKLARQYHPDVNPGNDLAEAKFKEITEAYEVLSDSDKRKRYEQFGQYWNQTGGMGGSYSSGAEVNFGNYGNFDEFINDLLGRFGGNSRGTAGFSGGSKFSQNPSQTRINLDAEITLSITFAEAFKGTERTLSVNDERVQIKIPKGIKPLSRLRVKGKGNLQPGTGRRGDLYLKIDVQSHQIWRLDGDQLRADLPVSFDEIALGATISVFTPDGSAQLNIPAGTMPGQNLRLKGKGWPRTNGRGDLIFNLKMQFPSKWSKQELELLENLVRLRSFDPRKDWFNSAML